MLISTFLKVSKISRSYFSFFNFTNLWGKGCAFTFSNSLTLDVVASARDACAISSIPIILPFLRVVTSFSFSGPLGLGIVWDGNFCPYFFRSGPWPITPFVPPIFEKIDWCVHWFVVVQSKLE